LVNNSSDDHRDEKILSENPLRNSDNILERGISPKIVEDEKTKIFEASKKIPVSQAAGYMGEQDMAFILGKMGHDPIIGPGGIAGKQTNERGFDYVGLNSKTGHILIADNKAVGIPGLVDEADALTSNFAQNVADAISQIEAAPSFVGKEHVISKLRELKDRLDRGDPNKPDGIDISITNAGGFATGISRKLQKEFRVATKLNYDLTFEDLVGQDTINVRKEDIKEAIKRGVKPGRGYGEATKTEPILNNKAISGKTARVLGKVNENGWELILALAMRTIIELIGLFIKPKIQEDIEKEWPRILSFLRENPECGVLIVYTFLVQDKIDLAELVLTKQDPRLKRYLGITLYYGQSPEAAYNHYLTSPPLYGTASGFHLGDLFFQWYSNYECYAYHPKPPQ